MLFTAIRKAGIIACLSYSAGIYLPAFAPFLTLTRFRTFSTCRRKGWERFNPSLSFQDPRCGNRFCNHPDHERKDKNRHNKEKGLAGSIKILDVDQHRPPIHNHHKYEGDKGDPDWQFFPEEIDREH